MTDTARQAVIDKVAAACYGADHRGAAWRFSVEGSTVRERYVAQATAVLDALSREDLLALLGAEQVGVINSDGELHAVTRTYWPGDEPVYRIKGEA